MAVPFFHITDADSGVYGANAFGEPGPGTLLIDADAWLISPGSTIVLQNGPWTATINGKVTSSNFGGGGNAGIYVHVFDGRSKITIGATGEVTGYNFGILSDTHEATDIVNKGRIVAVGPGGLAIGESFTAGDYTINNSGSIISAFHAVDFTISGTGSSGGTHTIINSGIIDAPVAITAIDTSTIEKVTNSGFIHGDVFLGNNNDVFTDFIKIKKHGKVVTHHGNVDGIIDLGEDNDTFNGGNNAEKVQDGTGADTYKLSGGDDILLAAIDIGSDGVDTIDGGAGRDTYDGSGVTGTIGGTDFLINLDKIAHDGHAANSIVFAVASLQADHIFNFEDVIGSPGSDIIYGNASANHLDGGHSSVSTVVHDYLFGLGGNDVLETSTTNGQLYGGDGNDTLSGGANTYMDGGNGNDSLTAGYNGGTLYGGAGADTLDDGDFSGGGGIHYTFVYKAISDSGVTAATRDVIASFKQTSGPGSSGDFIDLSAIDAIPSTKGIDDDFTFIGQAKWGHHAGELRYVSTADQTIVEADVNGDGKADFSIAINGHHALAATDFIL